MAKATPPVRCETCRWLEVPPNRAGVRRPQRGRAYRCGYIVPAQALPDSITRHYSYASPARSSMETSDGAECPTWKGIPPP